MKITPMPECIFVDRFKKGERKVGSIIIADDDKKNTGIRARWAKVYSVGSAVTLVKEGDWILIEHGRWSRKLDMGEVDGEKLELWVVEPVSIMLRASSEPQDEMVTAE